MIWQALFLWKHLFAFHAHFYKRPGVIQQHALDKSVCFHCYLKACSHALKIFIYILYHRSNVLFYVDWNSGLLFAKYNCSTVLFLHSTTEALYTFCACLKYHWISVKNAVKVQSTTKSSCGLVYSRLIKYHWILLCFSVCVWITTKTLWYSVWVYY